MKKEDVVEIMIYTVNNYNIEGAEKAGLTYEQIQNMLDTSRPGLEYMFNRIYDDLVKKGAITAE
jgi:polyhydroxyalkanoate synthesis regulator phasin